MEEWNFNLKLLVYLVNDNVLNMFKVGELFGCNVYILNIVVQKVLKVKIVSNMLVKVCWIVVFFYRLVVVVNVFKV